jgi:sensor histidine kinase regulating citrate/malate metabolism
MNLISNSIKSSAQTSSKEVTVSLNKLGDRKLSVEVTDSGKGIEKDDLKDLFKLGHSKSNDGLGLGLWVSKSITERQQATLEYIQHDDTQWCFRLTLDSTEYQK